MARTWCPPTGSGKSDARLRNQNETTETRVDRNVIMHSDGMGRKIFKISRPFMVLSGEKLSESAQASKRPSNRNLFCLQTIYIIP